MADAENLGKLFQAKALRESADAAAGLMTTVDDVGTRFVALAQQLRNLIDVELQTADNTEELVKIYKQIVEATRAVADTTEKASDKVFKFEYVVKPLIDRFVSLTRESEVLSGGLGAFGSILTMMGKTQLGLVVAGAKGLVDAYDATIKAQREVVYSQLQAGLSYKDHSSIIEENRQKLEKTAASWGMLGEKAAEFTSAAAGAGIGARPGATGSERARGTGEDLREAFQASIASSKAYGLSQKETMDSVIQFGTVFSAKGREFSTLMGEITEAGTRSSLGMRRHLDAVRTVTDATKEHGANLMATNVLLSIFDRQIKEGTITLDTIAKLAVPARLGTEALGFIAKSAMEAGHNIVAGAKTLPEAMDKIALSGEELNEALKGGKVDPGKLAESVGLVTGALERAIPGISKASGLEMQQALKAVGIDVSIKAAMDIFKNGAEGAAQALIKAGEKARAEDPAQKMVKAGEDVFKTFKTSGESFADYTVVFRDAVRMFKETVEGRVGEYVSERSERGAEMSGMSGTVYRQADWARRKKKGELMQQGLSTMEAEGILTGTSPQITRMAESRATGGFIPQDGPYTLHAGERVIRPGGSGMGISVSVGGVNVTVGERSDLRGQLHEAMAKVEDNVLKRIEEQWQAAGLAQ